MDRRVTLRNSENRRPRTIQPRAESGRMTYEACDRMPEIIPFWGTKATNINKAYEQSMNFPFKDFF